MRVLLQRVTEAHVDVAGQRVGAIGPGLLLFVGMTADDDASVLETIAQKVTGLRIFEDHEGRMNLSADDLLAAGVACGILVVSQFTLYGDVRKGRRPSFTDAAGPDIARPLIDRFCLMLRNGGFQVAEGQFGEHMAVSLVNDGPVTIWLDSDELRRPRRRNGERDS